MPLEHYHSLPGNRYWLTEEVTVCKSDVLAIFRTANAQSSVIEHIKQKNMEKNSG